MQISTESEGNRVQIQFSGEATIYHAAQIRETLQLALLAYPELGLDMERVVEVDTSMVQILASLFQAARHEGKAVRITKAGAAFADVARLCNLCQEFGLT